MKNKSGDMKVMEIKIRHSLNLNDVSYDTTHSRPTETKLPQHRASDTPRIGGTAPVNDNHRILIKFDKKSR